jgi:hypothetical protein
MDGSYVGLRRFLGAGAREDHSFQQALAAMRLKIDPPILRDDLLAFLRGSGCLALAEGRKQSRRSC